MEEGDVVLCTVMKIEGTSVFVNIEGEGQGSIILSEIAPGRIRNLRDYVIPNKKIACKVLRIEGGHVHLSLRRVTSKERQDLMKKYEAEKGIEMTLKRLLPEKWQEKLENIRKDEHVVDFFQKVKEDLKLATKYFTQTEIEKIQPLLKDRVKEVEMKQEFRLKSPHPDGLLKLKSILLFNQSGMEISYLAASRFVIKLKAQDYKTGNGILQQTLGEIEKRAKKNHCEFELIGR